MQSLHSTKTHEEGIFFASTWGKRPTSSISSMKVKINLPSAPTTERANNRVRTTLDAASMASQLGERKW